MLAEVLVGFARPEEPGAERGVRLTMHAGTAAAKRLLTDALRADPGLRLDLAEQIIARAQLHALARWSAQWGTAQ